MEAPSLQKSRSWVAWEEAGKTLPTPGKREQCDNIPAKKGKFGLGRAEI